MISFNITRPGRVMPGERRIMIGTRIEKLENFFKVKKPKKMNYIEWIEKLYEMEMKWEEKHQQPFPI